ncbi:hypothetical protein MSAN_00420000 [Mycena sanguinolenta]|uniref:F-box domain-containing protein n=1 Tax=Mycena sanguinolenta TaxID=230812 RepID=A0A8H6ZED0_9AGAR|nr:hypothetical protein MSAN_00420000 [Mycena sanguinolenta]
MSSIPSELIIALGSLRVADSMPAIPFELIAAIVDELEHDRASLKACSLVATPFCAPSQRHLFRAMWLHRENWQFYTSAQKALHRGTKIPSGTIKRVSALFSKSPHLAVYVRDLTIDLPDSADEDIPLAQVLQAVTKLERLVISGLVVRWDDLSRSLTSAILDVFVRPTLESLHLLNIQDLPSSAILSALSSMRVLSLHHPTLSDEETLEQGGPLIASKIHHLTLSSVLLPTYELILSTRAPKLGNVRKLLLDTSANLHIDRILTSVAATLVELDIKCGVLPFALMLPSLTSLRFLTLRIARGTTRRLPEGLWGTLVGLPRVSLTLVFAINTRLVEGEWAEEGPLTGLDDCQTKTMHCQLLFLDSNVMEATRNNAFDSFCAALRAALPGFELEFSSMDETSYINQLP